MKHKYLIFLLAVGFFYFNDTQSQILRVINLYEATHNDKYNSTDYLKLGIRRNIIDTSFYNVSTIKGNKTLLKVPRASVFEIFDNRYLLISLKSPELFLNGEPDFVKPRDFMYVIDLLNLKNGSIFKTELNGKKIYSNALELTKINRSFKYDFAIREISLVFKQMKLMDIETGKDIILTLIKVKV